MILDLVKPVFAEDAIIPTYEKTDFKYQDTIFGAQYTLGSILSDLLPYIYVIAGLLLLVLLIAGGFSLMTSAGNPDKMKAGYGKITSALTGFFIIFVSYIVALLVQTIFGIDIGFGSNSIF